MKRRRAASKSIACTNHGALMPRAASNNWLVMKVLPPAAAPTDRRRVWGQTNAGGRRRQCAPAAPCGFVDGAKQRRPQLHRGNNRKKQSIPALVQPTQNSKEAERSDTLCRQQRRTNRATNL